MKKTILLLLAMSAALAACGGDDEPVVIGAKPTPPIDTSGPNNNGNTTTPGNEETPDAGFAVPTEALTRYEFPKLKGGSSKVIVHRAVVIGSTGKEEVNYSVEWDTSKNAQRWSCYYLTPSIVSTNTAGVSRYNADNTGLLTPDCQYPNDQDLEPEYQMVKDPYKYSGYDHGHICPSADRQKSSASNYQTFFITNMQPQYNKFNAGIWESMETRVRQWALKSDTLWVCKGGTIDADKDILEWVCQGSHQSTRVNSDHIPVPKYFYMAVFSKKGTTLKAMAFWVEQQNADRKSDNLANYAITVDRLEQLTGIDFFCNLPDAVEEEQERQLVLSDWELAK